MQASVESLMPAPATRAVGAAAVADLRSDTATRPSARMYEAIHAAPLGDDCHSEDPTVLHLQARVAALLGKAAGLYFPSGTQSNCAALLTHCGRGEEFIVGVDYHAYSYEGGGASALGGIFPRTLEVRPDGTLDATAIEDAIRPNDLVFARSRLIALENTSDGRAIDAPALARMLAPARAGGLSAHLDGARIMNAAVALGVPPAELAKPFDSVSMCLSKGLGAPVGSVLVGTPAFIREAARQRRKLGGGMRQSGMLAACGLVALEDGPEQLARDHENAATLSRELKGLSATLGRDRLAVEGPHTNMVFLSLSPDDHEGLASFAKARGILLSGRKGEIRVVLHRDVSVADVARTVETVRDYYKG